MCAAFARRSSDWRRLPWWPPRAARVLATSAAAARRCRRRERRARRLVFERSARPSSASTASSRCRRPSIDKRTIDAEDAYGMRRGGRRPGASRGSPRSRCSRGRPPGAQRARDPSGTLEPLPGGRAGGGRGARFRRDAGARTDAAPPAVTWRRAAARSPTARRSAQLGGRAGRRGGAPASRRKAVAWEDAPSALRRARRRRAARLPGRRGRRVDARAPAGVVPPRARRRHLLRCYAAGAPGEFEMERRLVPLGGASTQPLNIRYVSSGPVARRSRRSSPDLSPSSWRAGETPCSRTPACDPLPLHDRGRLHGALDGQVRPVSAPRGQR